jgi:glucokinase
MKGWRIVCDVGGTNIRIARSDGLKQLTHLQQEATERCTALPEALQQYWLQFDDRESLVGAAIAAAGPVEAGSVTLTNRPLTIEREAVSAGLGGRPVELFNDLEATAYAVPLLTAEDLLPVVPVSNSTAGPRLVVNVGTGFGAALLVQTATGWQAVATEAGHMTLGTCEQRSSIERTALGALSVEDRISGLALSTATSLSFDRRIFSPAFGELFGAVCGNLVLATGAWGGVALCGSVAAAWCRTGEFASFTAAFRDKGRMSKRMDRVLVSGIVLSHPALIGLTTVGQS